MPLVLLNVVTVETQLMPSGPLRGQPGRLGKFFLLLITQGDQASLDNFLLGRDDQVPFGIQGTIFKNFCNKASTSLRVLSGRSPGSGTGLAGHKLIAATGYTGYVKV